MCSFNQLKCRGETTAVEDTRDPRVFPTIVKSPSYCKSPVYSKKGNDQLILDLSCYPLIKTQCLRVTLLITRKKTIPDQPSTGPKKGGWCWCLEIRKTFTKTKLPKITKKITPQIFTNFENPHFRNPWLYLFWKFHRRIFQPPVPILLKGSDPYRILIKNLLPNKMEHQV